MKPKEIVPVVNECNKLGDFPGFYYPNVLMSKSYIEDETLLVDTTWNSFNKIVQVDLKTGEVQNVGNLFDKRQQSFFLLDVDPINKLICAYVSSPTQQPAIVIKRFNEAEWHLICSETSKNDLCKWNWQLLRLSREGKQFLKKN